MFLIATSSGQFDLPAMINFALSKSGQKDLHYIGHSQGTTSFFVMASLRTEMNSKIRTMHAFGMKLETNICWWEKMDFALFQFSLVRRWEWMNWFCNFTQFSLDLILSSSCLHVQLEISVLASGGSLCRLHRNRNENVRSLRVSPVERHDDRGW